MTKFDGRALEHGDSVWYHGVPLDAAPSPHTCAYEPHAYPGSVPRVRARDAPHRPARDAVVPDPALS